MWECEWQRKLNNSSELLKIVDSFDIRERLRIRDAFFGGRTNAIKLYHKVAEDEKIFYVDYTSLYPYVCKYGKFPTDHPVIITKNFDWSLKSYFGVVLCSVLPPRNLYHPVLPCRTGGKLVFPLCAFCASSGDVRGCHCPEKKRMLHGTWSTPELSKALQLGYRLVEIREVYHYPQTTQYNKATGEHGLFSQFIDFFLRIKQEASDYPDWVKHADNFEQAALQYVNHYRQKEGVQLEKESIKKNPALRSLAKLLLNSFWGKFGQNSNYPKTEFITEPETYFQRINDCTKHCLDFNIISDDIIQLDWENDDRFLEDSIIASDIHAALVTAYGRLKLYDLLEQLQKRVLYLDTDSVIFTWRKGEWAPKLGDCLGELTSELADNDHIVEFVSGGPKQYAYKTLMNEEACKIRGFSLNYSNSHIVHFDALKDYVCNIQPFRLTTLVNPSKIVRNKDDYEIISQREKGNFTGPCTQRGWCGTIIRRSPMATIPSTTSELIHPLPAYDHTKQRNVHSCLSFAIWTPR